jgi:hypothetical protein
MFNKKKTINVIKINKMDKKKCIIGKKKSVAVTYFVLFVKQTTEKYEKTLS